MPKVLTNISKDTSENSAIILAVNLKMEIVIKMLCWQAGSKRLKQWAFKYLKLKNAGCPKIASLLRMVQMTIGWVYFGESVISTYWLANCNFPVSGSMYTSDATENWKCYLLNFFETIFFTNCKQSHEVTYQ